MNTFSKAQQSWKILDVKKIDLKFSSVPDWNRPYLASAQQFVDSQNQNTAIEIAQVYVVTRINIWFQFAIFLANDGETCWARLDNYLLQQ